MVNGRHAGIQLLAGFVIGALGSGCIIHLDRGDTLLGVASGLLAGCVGVAAYAAFR